jgi:hypothetical protein
VSRSLPRAAAVADRRIIGLSREVLAEPVAELGRAGRRVRTHGWPIGRGAIGVGAGPRLVSIDRLLATLVHLRHEGSIN